MRIIERKYLEEYIKTLGGDIKNLEVFYFASLLHLKFVHIHPFSDGNGRIARILEKWFITQKLGNMFWRIASERYYKLNQAEYYRTIDIGVNYYELNYDRCLPFLRVKKYFDSPQV